jgi:hypothetical protein
MKKLFKIGLLLCCGALTYHMYNEGAVSVNENRVIVRY